jgi:4-amino-4-deoxy-L-arabinose transferase-like glycosyltransferase
MHSETTLAHPRPINLTHAALIGAIALAVCCLMFWASAAAQALPGQVPSWVRTFTPAAGLTRLALGLFWTATAGALLAVVLAGATNLVRRARHHPA